MAWRFRRTVKIAPGIRLNLNKRGPSIRVGPKGVGATVGPRSARVSAGIPGTGFYAYKQVGYAGGRRSTSVAQVDPSGPPIPRGERFPGGWAALSAVLTFFAIVAGAASSAGFAVFSLLTAAGCAFAMYRRMRSPAYRCATLLRQAGKATGDEVGRLLGLARRADPSSIVAIQASAYYLLTYRDDPKSAIAEFEAALKLQPTNPESTTGLAAAHQASGDHAAAISLLEPWLSSIDPDTAAGQRVLGLLSESLLDEGDPMRALEVVKRAPLRRRNLDPWLMYCLVMRGRCSLAIGRKSDARRDFDRLYAIDPEFPDLRELIARAQPSV